MKKPSYLAIFIITSLLAAVLFLQRSSLTAASPLLRPLLQSGSPTVVSYQGYVAVSGSAYDGSGYFKFAVVDSAGTTSYWSNDGTSTAADEPAAAVTLSVTDGLFQVYLGDTALGGMTQSLSADVFDGTDRYLRVWFSADNVTFDLLSPDRRVTAVPYALQAEAAKTAADADTLDGLDSSAYQPLVTGTCTSGNAIRIVNADGSVTCEAITSGSTYSAGTGLDLTGTTFSITDTYRLPQTCSSGQLARWNNTTSLWECGNETAPAQVIWVATSGGDFTSIQAALDSITDASATKPYLVMVAPGTYTEQVTMKEYVDIQGSGEGATIIRYTGSNGNPGLDDSSSATVIGADNAELRFLTIESDSTLLYATGIFNVFASPTLAHVTISASGGTDSHGIFNDSSSPAMTDVTISASGGSSDNIGIFNYNSSPSMVDITVSVSGSNLFNWGVYNHDSSPTMHNVTVNVSGVSSESYGVFNNNSSPAMFAVSVTVSGTTDTSYGVFNTSASSPTMQHVTISVSDATYDNNGVYNQNSSPAMFAVSVTISDDADFNYGVHNNNSSPTMQDVTVTISGGTATDYGVYNDNSSSPTIQDSSLAGSTYSIYNISGGSAQVAHSVISGTVTVGSGLTCSDVTDGATGDLLDTACNSGADGQVLKSDGSGNVTWQDDAPAQVIWVATSGGDFTSIQAALDSITDASATKPYLIMVAPGTYTEQVTMKEYVDIQGSGEGATIIRYTGGTPSPDASTYDSTCATVIGADNAELRFLTVTSAGAGENFASAIHNEGASPTLTYVTATASGGSRENYGVYNTNASPTMQNATVTVSGGSGFIQYGVLNISSSPAMFAVIVTVSGGSDENYGVSNDNSSPTMQHVTVSVSDGNYDNIGVANDINASPTIRDSSLTGSTGSIRNTGTGSAQVANSLLDGSVVVGGGLTCVGAYDATYTSLDTSCQ